MSMIKLQPPGRSKADRAGPKIQGYKSRILLLDKDEFDGQRPPGLPFRLQKHKGGEGFGTITLCMNG